MLAFEDATQVIQSSACQLDSEYVDIDVSFNRILAEDVISDINMPPFDRYAMDGYASRRSDLANELSVIETIPAGYSPRKTIGINQCARIITGSVVLHSADCVIMVEQTDMQTSITIRFARKQTANNIYSKGENVRVVEVVLLCGTRIRAQHIATFAAVGCIRSYVSLKLKAGFQILLMILVKPNPLSTTVQHTSVLCVTQTA